MPLLRATSSTLRSVVNGQDTPSMIIFFSAMVHASLIAPNGQPLLQVPHLMHLSVSMWCGFFSSPVMAPAGQLRAHFVQPLQMAGSMT